MSDAQKKAHRKYESSEKAKARRAKYKTSQKAKEWIVEDRNNWTEAQRNRQREINRASYHRRKAKNNSENNNTKDKDNG